MDWTAEAEAIIKDVKPYVSSIKIVQRGDDRIYLEIETLEEIKLDVTLDSKGFCICDNGQRYNTNQQLAATSHKKSGAKISETIYETIYALLNDISVRYREAFAIALIDKVKTLEER